MMKQVLLLLYLLPPFVCTLQFLKTHHTFKINFKSYRDSYILFQMKNKFDRFLNILSNFLRLILFV